MLLISMMSAEEYAAWRADCCKADIEEGLDSNELIDIPKPNHKLTPEERHQRKLEYNREYGRMYRAAKRLAKEQSIAL